MPAGGAEVWVAPPIEVAWQPEATDQDRELLYTAMDRPENARALADLLQRGQDGASRVKWKEGGQLFGPAKLARSKVRPLAARPFALKPRRLIEEVD
jgi:hypothetical protein